MLKIHNTVITFRLRFKYIFDHEEMHVAIRNTILYNLKETIKLSLILK